MTGEEIRKIREDLDLSTERFGRALGYHGAYGAAARHIRRFESGARPIPRAVERLAVMFGRHGVPDPWTRLAD
jgi:DNA-binding transcriptional regulator YiaG